MTLRRPDSSGARAVPGERLDLTGPRLEPMLRSFMRDRRRSTESLDLPLYALRSFMTDRRAGYDRAAQALTLAGFADVAGMGAARHGPPLLSDVVPARKPAGR